MINRKNAWIKKHSSVFSADTPQPKRRKPKKGGNLSVPNDFLMSWASISMSLQIGAVTTITKEKSEAILHLYHPSEPIQCMDGVKRYTAQIDICSKDPVSTSLCLAIKRNISPDYFWAFIASCLNRPNPSNLNRHKGGQICQALNVIHFIGLGLRRWQDSDLWLLFSVFYSVVY